MGNVEARRIIRSDSNGASTICPEDKRNKEQRLTKIIFGNTLKNDAKNLGSLQKVVNFSCPMFYRICNSKMICDVYII